ncbi:nucleoside-diphosphate kinase, partial [Kibdelosporangium lantanae]
LTTTNSATAIDSRNPVTTNGATPGNTTPDRVIHHDIRNARAVSRCTEVQYNLVHGSDSADSAKREIDLWFPSL